MHLVHIFPLRAPPAFKIKVPSKFMNPTVLGELYKCELAASAHVTSEESQVTNNSLW
jgi:hypothetical protein